MLAIEGFVALPRRGLEVGGVLVGEIAHGEVRIEGFREVTCEHRYGPSFLLSESDRAGLQELLAEPRPGTQPVVGMFRSVTSRDAAVSDLDEAIMNDCCPRGDGVFLRLIPQSAEKCLAVCRFFRDGKLLPGTDDPPLVFDPKRMPPAEPSAAGPQQVPSNAQSAHDSEPAETEPPVMAEPAPEEVAPRPPLPPPYRARMEPPEQPVQEVRATSAGGKGGTRAWAWIAAVCCLLTGASAAVIFALWPLAQRPRWAELHLEARTAGKQLELTWDTNASRAVGATRGLLTVTDGDSRRGLEFDAGQIAAGKYMYTPAHNDLDFRLILYTNGLGATGDSVHVTTIPAASAPADQRNRSTGDAGHSAPAPAPTPAPAKAESRVAVPPTTLHEVQPVIPEGIRSRLAERVVIPVEIYVNERGRVLRVTAEPQEGDSVRRYLAAQAEKAAWEWRFTPAKTRTGVRVAADKTILFVFTP
jgi:hypothetical protein